MNTSEIKADLHILIENINDETILNAVRTILSKQSKRKTDWADELSDGLRAELEKSLVEADKGQIISHEDAMNQIKTRYNLK
jgi:predicted transcriptional regulator